MSLYTTIFTRQLFKHRLFCQHLSVTTSSSSRDKKYQDNSRWNFKKNIVISCTAIVGFSFLTDSFEFPNVTAASAPVTRRSQFNFIADVVETASKSLVFIEIQDARRIDYRTGTATTVSNGSGFIVESDGLILTNAHVVINKPRSIVSVRLIDGRTFQGTVEAIDQISDLATVRIQCKNLPTLKLGSSSDLRSGEFVIALGSPLSLSNTVTAGVVSSTQRPSKELGLQDRNINFIQTDAAITFGNSGGPLVNLDGEAIGINSMKVTAGISFAIPIDYAKNFLKLAEEKVKKGKTSSEQLPNRRYMGITMLSMTPQIIGELKQRGTQIPDNIKSGILVWKVILGSPAHTSGLMAGDIILNINGNDVTQSSDIYEILASKTKSLNMILLRNGQVVKTSVIPESPE